MRLSTKGRYATRIFTLVFPAFRATLPVPKKKISEQEGISTDYIEQIIVPLKNAGLVSSVRGLRGGFRLAKKPEDITVLDILSASEGDINLVGCLSEGLQSVRCLRHSVGMAGSQRCAVRLFFKDYAEGPA